MTDSPNSQQPASLTIDQALQQAITHHQAGRLSDAELLYRAILKTQHNHPDANHNLGVLAVHMGQHTASLPHFKAALDATPNNAQFWLSYIEVLILTGQEDIARDALEQARQLGLQGEAMQTLAARLVIENRSAAPSADKQNALVALFNNGRYADGERLANELIEDFPSHGFGWNALGVMLQQQGRVVEALLPMQKAAMLLPKDAGVHANLGVVLRILDRASEAEASLRRALELNPDLAEAHCNLGATLLNLGRLVEAEASLRRALELKADFADAHGNLGNILKEQGSLLEAEACYRRALAINPRHVGVYSNLGAILLDIGNLAESEASLRRALELNPDSIEANTNLGNTLKEQGRLIEAEKNYRRTLEISPDYAKGHCNLGNILNAQGRLDEAEASLRLALELNPDLAEAHCNLGATLLNLGRLVEAEASLRRALEIKPDSVEALNSLAIVCIVKGEPTMALSFAGQSLHIKESVEAKGIFVACVKRLQFMQVTDFFLIDMVRALTEPWCRPSELARVGANLVRHAPITGEYVTRAVEAWPNRLTAQDLYGPDELAAVAADSLLKALLGAAPACGVELERFLTMARHAMLYAATEATAGENMDMSILNFYGALAQQCFINEYVFAWTDDEAKQARKMRDVLVAAMEAEKPISGFMLVAVAAYFPLHSLPLACRLLDKPWPDTVTAVLAQQIREPEEERQIRGTISQLTTIEDEVSLLVKSQYEENPYPRWIKAEPAGYPSTVDNFLHRSFPLAVFQPRGVADGSDILIAGCGTGQHPIDTARQFLGARVLAVDLSQASLCYAKRKTQELGLTTIEYGQADILKLSELGRSFDVIESSGVLHHLADPFAGWQVLLSLLRPGGFMRLGFYSEVARRGIVRARDFIAEQGYGQTAEDIRQCRQDIIDSDESAGFGTILKLTDFYSTSTCRDLLFHVQEHRMTLPTIETFLQEQKLQFLGFQIESNALRAYRLRFPDDPSATNLGNWQIYENENPDTFIGMYQFWVQKTG